MSDGSTTRTIERTLRALAVERGSGARLPSSRELVARLGVSPVTVRAVVARLEREGVLETRPGVGTFATGGAPAPRPVDLAWQTTALGPARADTGALVDLVAPPVPAALVLSAGYPDPSLLPTALLATTAARVARRASAWGRVPLDGLPDLRDLLARDIGGGLAAGDVTVCPGGQAALTTVFRSLVAAGEPVLVESPTYIGALVAARAAGLTVIPVAGDAEGPDPADLADAFARTGARLLYAQPTHANPSGATWSSARRREVLAVAATARAFVVEDDWAAGRLTFGGEEPTPLARLDTTGCVVHLRGLSKPIAPSVRIAALAARGPAGARIRSGRVAEDLFVSGLLQEVALEVLAAPALDRHLRRVRATLLDRRDALLAALATALPDWRPERVPTGGFHLWVALPASADADALARRAEAAGVVVTPGAAWFPAEPTGPYLRVSFAGAVADDLRAGVGRLAG